MDSFQEIVDVVVPTYNVKAYLTKFFDSFLAQSFKNFKLVIVFDQSEDDSLALLEYYQRRFLPGQMEIIISTKKDGLGAARDIALDSALLQGQFVTFVDPDDYVDEHYLALLVEKQRTTNADLVICGFDRIDEKTGKIIAKEMVNNGDEVIHKIEKVGKIVYYNVAVWNKLFKLSLVQDLRFSNVKRAEDLPYFLKVLPLCQSIAFVNQPLYHYVVRETSLVSTFDSRYLPEVLDKLQEVRVLYEHNPSTHKKFFPLLEAIVFVRLAIGMNTRVSIYSKKHKKTMRKLIREFLKANFPKWPKNSFLSFRYLSKNGFKSFALWCAKTLYRIRWFGLFVCIYRIFTKTTKKDIKW